MAKQLSKITIRLLSVSIVLTVIGIDHNVSDIEAALAVRTIMAEQNAYSGLDKGTFYVNNLLFNFAIGTDSEGHHIVLTSQVGSNNAHSGAYNHGFLALHRPLRYDILAPDAGRPTIYNTSQSLPATYGGHSIVVRAGPCAA